MADKFLFIPEKGTVLVSNGSNVRKGFPRKSADLVKKLIEDTQLSYVGYVLDGETVEQNSKWYLTPGGDFFWSGGVKDILAVPSGQKIICKPLEKLICTQSFGKRPEFYAPLGSPKGHNGLDFRTKLGNNPNDWKRDVFAVLDGTISEATETPTNGKYVRIAHDNGYESVYLHLSLMLVSKGQRVLARSKIGVSGNSGSASEAPHLHFGYRPQKYDKSNGYMGYIDPTPCFIDEIKYA
ncbi:MAG: M23 family metallopeptidase [Candidatus Paceibacterota bacterium]|jgi:murein DD-endopeptidase MepM/ murein hydrolase activator NlpD